MQSATNYSLANQSFYSCGLPRDDAFHIFRDPVKGDIPWTGATFGLTVLALFVWCQDQVRTALINVLISYTNKPFH